MPSVTDWMTAVATTAIAIVAIITLNGTFKIFDWVKSWFDAPTRAPNPFANDAVSVRLDQFELDMATLKNKITDLEKQNAELEKEVNKQRKTVEDLRRERKGDLVLLYKELIYIVEKVQDLLHLSR